MSPTNPPHLAFLHTAAAHVGTFGALMAENAPDIEVRHHVEAPLLAEAIEAGGIGPELQGKIAAALRKLVESDAILIVCTCSTIGGVAEALSGKVGQNVPVLRVDRAMAEAAVAAGRDILVIASLESTLAPTRDLIQSVAQAQGKDIALRGAVIPDAWEFFATDDFTRYRDTMAAGLRAEFARQRADAIVLAQASAAEAAEQCGDLGVPILASPRPGVAAAIAAYRTLKS